MNSILSLFFQIKIATAQPVGGGGGSPVGGGGGVPTSACLPNPLDPSGSCGSSMTLIDVLQRVIDWINVMAIPVFIIIILYGAFQILTAAGAPDKIKKGREAIKWAIIAYAIIHCAWGIVSIVKQLLGAS